MSAASDSNAPFATPSLPHAGLLETHHTLRTMLERLNQLAADIADTGLTPQVRKEAGALHAWFAQAPAQHHALRRGDRFVLGHGNQIGFWRMLRRRQQLCKTQQSAPAPIILSCRRCAVGRSTQATPSEG